MNNCDAASNRVTYSHEQGDYQNTPEQTDGSESFPSQHGDNHFALCAGCDCVCDAHETNHTPNGAGPFCLECWQSLIDPDQTLLVEKCLADAEENIDRLKAETDPITTSAGF